MRGWTFRAVFVLLIGLHTALMCVPRIFPLIDLPYQLAAATIYRYHDTPGNDLADTYGIDIFPKPNVAHFLFCGSGLIPGSVETANRIFLLLCVVLLPIATLLVIRRWRGDPWLALPAFLLVYHYSYSWGFPGYALALPFVLGGLLLLSEHRARPRRWSRLVLAIWPLLLYGMHLLAALFYAWLLALHAVTLLRRAPRRALLDLAALAPLAGLIVLWLSQGGSAAMGGPGLLPELRDYYTRFWLESLIRRAALFFWDNHAVLPGAAGFAVAGLFSGSIAALAGLAWRRRRAAPKQAATSTFAFGPLDPGDLTPLLLLAAGSAYLLVPFKIPGTAHLFERFAVLVMLALLLFAARRMTIGPRLRVALVGLCLLHVALWTDYQVEFKREIADFDRDLLPEPGPDVVLGAFVFDAGFRGRPVFIHFPDYYTVWKQGVTVSKVGDYRFYPVHRIASEERLPEYDEWIGRFGDFEGTSRGYDGRYARLAYLLSRGLPPPELRHALAGHRVVRISGDWTLHQREG